MIWGTDPVPFDTENSTFCSLLKTPHRSGRPLAHTFSIPVRPLIELLLSLHKVDVFDTGLMTPSGFHMPFGQDMRTSFIFTFVNLLGLRDRERKGKTTSNHREEFFCCGQLMSPNFTSRGWSCM